LVGQGLESKRRRDKKTFAEELETLLRETGISVSDLGLL